MEPEHVITISSAQENLDAFNKRMTPHASEYQRRINEIVRSRRNQKARLLQLQELLDDVTSHVQDNAACRHRCSHCCHIPVIIHEHEAALIGEAIGRKPHRPARWFVRDRDMASFDSSYANPCTFLVDGKCSIYADRPIACRQLFNMAPTEELCRMDEVRDGVPYLNLFMFAQATVMICGDDHVADIREFFPRSAS